MELIYSAEQPVKVELMGARRRLNYNVRELSESEVKELWEKAENKDVPYDYFAKEHKYAYNTTVIGGAKFNYNNLVEEIIRNKYSADEMEAITNNMNVIVAEFFNVLVTDGITQAIKYLLTSVKSDNMANFKAMQEWRALAKREARDILKMY